MSRSFARPLHLGIVALAALLLVLLLVPAGANAAPVHGKSPAHTVQTSPQPPSKADFTGHGANKHGAYDSTRNGAPSLNGSGNGASVGKPCAACVGKADNKNPNGQAPNGSDPNAGYECDRNHGIGRTNPAHSGCVATSTPPGGPPSTSPGGSPSTSPQSGQSGSVGLQLTSASSGGPAHLAFTGTDIATLVEAGAALLGAGVLLSALGRLRRRSRA